MKLNEINIRIVRDGDDTYTDTDFITTSKGMPQKMADEFAALLSPVIKEILRTIEGEK